MLSSYHISRIKKPAEILDPPTPAEMAGEKVILPRRALVRLDLLKGPFGIFMLSYLAFYAFQFFPLPLFPIAYVDRMNLTDGMIGLGSALFYGTMMLASFRLSYISAKYGHRKVLIASATVFPIYPLLIAIGKSAEYYYAACLLGGAVYALLSAALLNRLMERVPADDRPAHMALHNMALNIGILAGSLLGPLSADLIGLQPSIYLAALLRFLSAGLFWLWG
jgi:predicted MFS family arabinose efflux permease